MEWMQVIGTTAFGHRQKKLRGNLTPNRHPVQFAVVELPIATGNLVHDEGCQEGVSVCRALTETDAGFGKEQ